MEAFEILGDPVRRRILELLAAEERPAGEIASTIGAEFGLTQPAVSRHLRLLRESGFADVRLMTFGFPLGHVLEKSRNLLARVAKPDESREERTGASGRRFQPSGRKGLVTQALSTPFRVAQRPFYDTRLGAGLFAVVRREG